MKYQVEETPKFYCPEGYKLCELVDAKEEPSQWGERLKLTFMDDTDQFSLWVSPKINDLTYLGKILKGMGAKLEVGKEIDPTAYLHMSVGLILGKNESGFPKLLQVLGKDKAPF